MQIFFCMRKFYNDFLAYIIFFVVTSVLPIYKI